jgi:hypothetical protein
MSKPPRPRPVTRLNYKKQWELLRRDLTIMKESGAFPYVQPELVLSWMTMIENRRSRPRRTR